MPGMPMDEEFVASWYIHILGHELQSMTITPNTADAVIRKGLPATFPLASTKQDVNEGFNSC